MKRVGLIAVLALLGLAAQLRAGDRYKADPVHSSVIFSVRHAGAGNVWGRFNDPAGSFVLDEADPTKSTFTVEIPVANIDTHNDMRDTHLKSPAFFDVEKYPTITFKSTSVAKGKDNTLDVTGTLDMHGVTKTITIPVELLGKGEFPPGTQRFGVEARFSVKKSEYKVVGVPGVGDEIKVIVAIEGTKQ